MAEDDLLVLPWFVFQVCEHCCRHTGVWIGRPLVVVRPKNSVHVILYACICFATDEENRTIYCGVFPHVVTVEAIETSKGTQQ
jgi:hypothetical protein